jgi:hypothetical protein
MELFQTKFQNEFSEMAQSLKQCQDFILQQQQSQPGTANGTTTTNVIRRFSTRFAENSIKSITPVNISDSFSNKDSEPHHRMSIVSNVTNDSINEIGPSSDFDEASHNRSPVNSGDYSFLKTSLRNNMDAIPENGRPSSKLTLPKSSFLEEDLLPFGEKNVPFENTIDNLIETIGPTEQQIQHRHSLIALLKKMIRLTLGGSVFEVGITAACAILPDDPVRIMITLPKALLPTWHTVLCDSLNAFAERVNSFGGSLYTPTEEDEAHLDPYFTDPTPLKNHFLGNITHMKQNLSHIVQLVIDSIPIEITANNRIDLCMLGFFEEISNMLNENYLLKRSYLLIRAWWCYETPAFVGCVIRHYLTDYQLFIMILAIFNQYHSYIQHPFQSLCLFLAEYSTYDGSTQAITLGGITTFQTRSSNQPQIPDIQSFHLLKQEFLEKYWHIFNVAITQDIVHDAAAAINSAHKHRNKSTSSEDPSDTIDGQQLPPKLESLSAEEIAALEKIQVLETLKNFSATNLQFFDRSAFNIVHPLNHTNMITEKLSQRRCSRLSRAFQIGATNLAFFLKRAQEEPQAVTPTGETNVGNNNANSNSSDNIKSYFPNVHAYPNPWVKQQKDSPVTESL